MKQPKREDFEDNPYGRSKYTKALEKYIDHLLKETGRAYIQGRMDEEKYK